MNEWYNALFEYFVDDFKRLLEDLAALRVVQRTSSDVADNHGIDIERRCIAILFHFFQTLQNAGMASCEMRIHAEGLSWETWRQLSPCAGSATVDRSIDRSRAANAGVPGERIFPGPGPPNAFAKAKDRAEAGLL